MYVRVLFDFTQFKTKIPSISLLLFYVGLKSELNLTNMTNIYICVKIHDIMQVRKIQSLVRKTDEFRLFLTVEEKIIIRYSVIVVRSIARQFLCAMPGEISSAFVGL